VKLLVEAGSDVDGKDSHGRTSLHEAKDIAIIDYLLSAKAFVDSIDG
jgi:ankyrin repeat protein